MQFPTAPSAAHGNTGKDPRPTVPFPFRPILFRFGTSHCLKTHPAVVTGTFPKSGLVVRTVHRTVRTDAPEPSAGHPIHRMLRKESQRTAYPSELQGHRRQGVQPRSTGIRRVAAETKRQSIRLFAGRTAVPACGGGTPHKQKAGGFPFRNRPLSVHSVYRQLRKASLPFSTSISIGFDRSTSPARIRFDRSLTISRWIVRFTGRAPYSGS